MTPTVLDAWPLLPGCRGSYPTAAPGVPDMLAWLTYSHGMAKSKSKSKSKQSAQSAPTLRVWWIPQVPGKPFHVSVKSVDEAKLVIRTLANYDLFQFENHIKGDYCNAGGLEQLEPDGEWFEWEDADGYSIDVHVMLEASDGCEK